MKKIILLLSALILLGCHPVSEEEVVPEPTVEMHSTDFSHVDSMYLSGEFIQVRDSLLQIIMQDSTCTDEALFRLLGLFHQRAMEDEFIQLLENLEIQQQMHLWGWKVSALSLAREYDEAIRYVPCEAVLLGGWLQWQMDSIRTLYAIPGYLTFGEIYCLAQLADSGDVPPSVLDQMVPVSFHFPSVRSVILRELSLSVDTAGAWWDSLLLETAQISNTNLLALIRKGRGIQLPLEQYLLLQQFSGPVCTLATREMLHFHPLAYSPSWDVSDRLVESGGITLAREYSSAGDQWHRLGTEMMILLQEEKHTDLLTLCGNVGTSAPDSIRARAAFMRANALRDAGRGGSVCYPEYLSFASEFPWHSEAREAAYNAGKYYDCEQEWGMSADAYLISLGTSGSWGGDERAHWRGGFTLYMSGRFDEADSLWAAGCQGWPFGYWRDEMLFWRARLAGERGDLMLRDSLLLTVIDEHPWEFYGILAARRKGVSSDQTFTVPSVRLADHPICSLAVELTADGYGVAALEMLKAGSKENPAETAIALSLMGSHGNSLNALRLLDMSLRDSMISTLPDSLVPFYFPAPYRNLAIQATDTLQLSAVMLQGIMREESYFNRWVVSRAGAMGVIQLMPGTASDVARWYGLPPLAEDEFFDPFRSVPYGAIYIDRQRDRFSGDIPLFLAAYNAGPGNASRWVDMHGWNPLDPESYIEQITYRETRMYVKKVLRSSWVYERF